ncbi:uncharacterized protein M437DRAFT_49149 [Aureobasidium melanogenum CBS 110374]|uniref:SH3 domain-containing protein n=1 Tax=Aureobasidium melanogenum (strain CBS 110374) TaxID=1043003 RepID=A0A074VNN7_AURM1|nr:uncharacterized protein M437DRAFT_49149 [Aureobasidium melanogenum CBS 110374]KEQ62335.1 hypothetical protein M437DRAFT_49149 [Aureobasidium melanogenum CBS 110374]
MSAPPFKVKAVYEYASPHEDDLPFPEGQIITVVALEDADWYEGEYTDASGNKHKGLFPKNFVERYEPEVPSRPARRPQSEIRSPPPQPPVPEPAPGAFPEEADKDDDDDSFAEPPPVPAQSKSVVEPEAAPAPLPPRDLSPPAADPPKKEPPPVSSKPSSFRDRIAAFNNAGAAPVAPFKPAAPTFVKKPFVAPPPSKNAYIPPPKAEPVQKIYRREEDPDIQKEQAQADENAAKAGLLPSDHPQSPTGEEDEDQPKPQSLKERIAMLQKQQMEQAARRADVSDKPKPKKPVKKNTDDSAESAAAPPPPVPQAHVPAAEEEDDVEQPERHVRQSLDQPRDRERTRGASARGVSREPALPTAGNEMLSDSNDADMSGAGDITEENDVDSDSTQPARKSMQSQRAPAAPVEEADVGEQQDTTEDDESEEDEMDAETRRRMELRERMAKMSGGMGMAGMFGGPPGMPGMMAPAPPKPKKTKEPKPEHDEAAASAPAPAQAPRVPVIPIPGMQTARSPEVEDRQLAVEKEPEHDTSVTSEREPLDVPDVEDVKPQPPPHIEPVHRVPPIPQDRPLASPTSERAPPPPVPGARPVPAPPVPESRPVPPPPPPVDTQMDPTEGEESDDERSLAPTRQSTDMSRGAPPPVPRPEATRSPSMGSTKRASTFGSLDAMSPTSPATPASEKRQSRIPPIPGTLSTPPQARAPPPPPPTGAPQLPPIIPSAPLGEPDEGESEYEGDYDTDIASSVAHKDALKSHARDSSIEEADVPAPAPAPRAVPPPPPTQPPPTRASIDAPRMAPPPVPVHAPVQPEQYEDEEDDYQEPPRALPIRAVPPPPPTAPAPVPVQQEYVDDSSDDLYDAPPPRQSMDRPPPPPPVDQDRAAPLPPSQPPQIARTGTHQSRQSLDVSRPSMNMRRSMDVGRPPQDGHIATDVDLAESSLWWANPNTPPPVFQNRSDILFEVEENVTQRRGGRTAITKDVYVLFIDYSQTVITARYDGQNPQEVSFEQRHEPPPPRLRQDQLETAWQKYGARMSEAAAAKKDQVVGDGSPNALVLDLLKPFTDALRPVGTRAYGALVYANLANASVQQFDEIRAGDIITLRNAKLQGKHGAMHKSYAMDVSSHVGVVVDWDGTKKKVRAWEQGREKAKTRMESFRLGDLRSGEVRVWRVVGREWVGWDS